MTRAARLRVEPLEDRLAPAAGQLDPSFGTGGVQHTTTGAISELAAAPDGRFLAIVGPYRATPNFLVRFNPDGSPDTSYGAGGVVRLPGNNNYQVLAPVADGGAYVGTVGNGGLTVVHVTPTGTVDTNFGTAGIAVVSIPGGSADTHLAAITVQSDGRILVAGDKTTDPLILGQPPRYYDGVLARLTSTGQLDTAFGTGGTVLVNDPSGTITSVFGGGLGVQPDGRILFAGSASATPRGVRSIVDQVYGPAVARLTSDGQLDTTFGTGGWSRVAFPDQSAGTFTAVTILPDGRVVLAGQIVQKPAGADFGTVVGGAARLTADGGLDTGYGTGGVGVTGAFASGVAGNSTSQFSTAGIDPSGRAVFVATDVSSATSITGSSQLVRLNTSGTPDDRFGTAGRVSVNQLLGDDTVDVSSALAVQPNGDIVFGGTDETGFQAFSNSGIVARVLGSTPPTGFVASTAGLITAGGGLNGALQVLTPTNGTYATAGTMTTAADTATTLRTATADVNGDGTPDYITVTGPGVFPRAVVYDGKTGNTLADFLPFEAAFTGGMFVDAADLDGDGRAEVVITPDEGGGPRVVIFSIAPGGSASPRASFFGIDDPNFRGGARVALGDVNKDGAQDLVVAAGFQGGPRVAIFNGTTLLTGTPSRLIGDFFAFPGADAVTLRNGVFVAAGDVNGDGYADLVFGGGPGGAPRVFTLSGAALTTSSPDAAQASPISNFFVGGDATDRGGVTVATATPPGDARATVAVGSGRGDAGRVRLYRGADITGAAEPTAFQDVTAFGGAILPGGVYVG